MTINTKFDIGETVWLPRLNFVKEEAVCPICGGENKIIDPFTGERIICNDEVRFRYYTCNDGMISYKKRIYIPEQEIIYDIGFRGEYTYYNSVPAVGDCEFEENIFKSREECQKRCDELNKKESER